MTKRERISKLESRMTTAEELLAELRGREGGIAVTGDLAEVADILNNRRRKDGTRADREGE
jgi:hypothetical protein